MAGAHREQPAEPSVTITLREIYDQVQQLRKWMWALPITALTSLGSMLVAMVR